MDYIRTWLVSGHVVEITAPEKCTEEFIKAFDADMMMVLDNVLEPIYVIIDVRSMKSYSPAQAFLNMAYLKHPYMGCLLTIGMTSHPVLRFMANLAARGMGMHVKDFATQSEAYAYISSIENIKIVS